MREQPRHRIHSCKSWETSAAKFRPDAVIVSSIRRPKIVPATTASCPIARSYSWAENRRWAYSSTSLHLSRARYSWRRTSLLEGAGEALLPFAVWSAATVTGCLLRLFLRDDVAERFLLVVAIHLVPGESVIVSQLESPTGKGRAGLGGARWQTGEPKHNQSRKTLHP